MGANIALRVDRSTYQTAQQTLGQVSLVQTGGASRAGREAVSQALAMTLTDSRDGEAVTAAAASGSLQVAMAGVYARAAAQEAGDARQAVTAHAQGPNALTSSGFQSSGGVDVAAGHSVSALAPNAALVRTAYGEVQRESSARAMALDKAEAEILGSARTAKIQQTAAAQQQDHAPRRVDVLA